MAPFNPIGHSLDNAHVKDLKLGGLRLRDIPGPVIVAIGAALLLARFTGRPMIAVTGVTGPIGASVVQALDKDRKLRVCGGAMKERVWEKWVLFKREFDFSSFCKKLFTCAIAPPCLGPRRGPGPRARPGAEHLLPTCGDCRGAQGPGRGASWHQWGTLRGTW